MRLLFVFCILFFNLNISLADSANWSIEKETHAGTKDIDVYFSQSCNCCKKWMKHLKAHDFNVTPKPTLSIQDIKNKHAIPGEYSSCHTAIIGGYIIEGHVPADDIKRLLKEKPNIKGLSVPAMPVGTPGMEHGNRKDPFYVITLPHKGEPEIFHSYKKY